MMAVLKERLRGMVPKSALALYHRSLAGLAALVFGFPSRSMLTVGVTGTKGKSTVSYLIARVLEADGRSVGLTTTALFKVGKKEWLNPTKMTMLGRFALERLLREMRAAGADAAVVESSAEGLLQWRHTGIDYDVAVWTNLTPDNIPLYGSFDQYRETKGRLFAALGSRSRRRKSIRGKTVPKVTIVNADDPSASFYLAFPSDEVWTFGTRPTAVPPPWEGRVLGGGHVFIENIVLAENGSEFDVEGIRFRLSLLGRVNVMNAGAAIALGRSIGISLPTIAGALESVDHVPGRFEMIEEGQNFKVMVDYAHEPESFKQLYETVDFLPHKRVIHVFGGTGGGRDPGRRAIMGEIAMKNADVVLVTMDDPYLENPAKIARDVLQGAAAGGGELGKNLFDIADRTEAIRAAVQMAKEGDLVLLTGKGSEQTMRVGGKSVPWDDRKVVRRIIRENF